MQSDKIIWPLTENDHIQGLDAAPVTLIEYGDFECRCCGIAQAIVRAVQRELGGMLRFAFRHFPVDDIHPRARRAAEAAEAAGAQNQFWEMHDLLLSHQYALGTEDLIRYAETLDLDMARFVYEQEAGLHMARVSEDVRHGIRSGVRGTPTFFINGVRLDRPWSNVEYFALTLREAAVPSATPSGTAVLRGRRSAKA